MPIQTQEARIILAIKAIRLSKKSIIIILQRSTMYYILLLLIE
jgi:hypothetical protein